MRSLPLLLLLTALGCRSDDKVDTTDTAPVDTGPLDADGDGYDTTVDCDDGNSVINPGGEETCDGVDNDCDGEVDEGVTSTFYADGDGDGFGDADAPTEACSEPTGYVGIGNDCDDSDPETYPAAAERCDGADNDCDGEIDEDVVTAWHADADGDGFGDPDSVIEDCDPPDGYAADDTDCDDLDGTAYPGAEEVCDGADNDCDDAVDEDVTATFYQDADGDGFGLSDVTTEDCDLPTGYSATAGDCDDADGTISPNATEVCDGDDNDCDGDTDEDDAADAATWYGDGDSDGYGDAAVTAVACDQPSGYVSDATDCDDSSADANPGEAEVCDGADNDCDGTTDEADATDASVWYADNDGDGYGGSSSTAACTQPSGFADNSDDCDDGEADANPGEAEVCDDIDNDCDGDTDEGLTSTFYADADGDGYGNSGFSTDACDAPTGYVSDATDCDDGDASASPGEAEVCDEVDNDCDGSTDEGVTATYYFDYDGDGYGDVDRSTAACSAPSGYVSDSADCDDSEAGINPAATEVCDEADNDCDGSTDEGVTTTYYADTDGDGFGDADSSAEACAEGDGYISDDTDCDDTDDGINPDAAEVCDDIDQDCDGDSASDDCADCAAILDAGLDTGDGVYAIDLDGEGGDDPFDVYCDMTTDGGGWTLWWWHEGTATMSGVTDVLDGEVWDCDPSSDTSCYAKMPVGDPDELLVTNQVGDWAVWEFDGTTTSDNVLDAFTNQTTVTQCSNAWTPVAQDGTMTDDPYVCDENNNADPGCDCFWYRSQGGVYSFYLDDDTGWAETAFAGGKDGSNSLGVDSLETSYRYSSTSYELWLYWR